MIHQQIAQERRRLGLTQRKLAHLAGVTQAQLNRLETGKNVTLETVQKVVTVLPRLEYRLVDAGVSEAAEAIHEATASLVQMVRTKRPSGATDERSGGKQPGGIKGSADLVRSALGPPADVPSDRKQQDDLQRFADLVRKALGPPADVTSDRKQQDDLQRFADLVRKALGPPADVASDRKQQDDLQRFADLVRKASLPDESDGR
jgi:transcriptional regulator with XRE-family HTH domain